MYWAETQVRTKGERMKEIGQKMKKLWAKDLVKFKKFGLYNHVTLHDQMDIQIKIQSFKFDQPFKYPIDKCYTDRYSYRSTKAVHNSYI